MYYKISESATCLCCARFHQHSRHTPILYAVGNTTTSSEAAKKAVEKTSPIHLTTRKATPGQTMSHPSFKNTPRDNSRLFARRLRLIRATRFDQQNMREHVGARLLLGVLRATRPGERSPPPEGRAPRGPSRALLKILSDTTDRQNKRYSGQFRWSPLGQKSKDTGRLVLRAALEPSTNIFLYAPKEGEVKFNYELPVRDISREKGTATFARKTPAERWEPRDTQGDTNHSLFRRKIIEKATSYTEYVRTKMKRSLRH